MTTNNFDLESKSEELMILLWNMGQSPVSNNDYREVARKYLSEAYEAGRASVLEKWPSKKEIIELSKKICKAEHCQHAFYKGYRASGERLGVGDE